MVSAYDTIRVLGLRDEVDRFVEKAERFPITKLGTECNFFVAIFISFVVCNILTCSNTLQEQL